jgi:hypothetical protein
MRRPRFTYANVMSTLAVCMLLSGTAYAATTLPKDSVGAKQLQKNAVRSSEVKDSSLQAKDFKPGQLPAGPKGDKGDRGDPGTPATKYWARVTTFTGGGIYAASGTVTVTHAGSTGKYTAAYPVDVSNCATLVTPNVGINSGHFAVTFVPTVAYGSDNLHTDISFVDGSGAFATPYGFNVATLKP